MDQRREPEDENEKTENDGEPIFVKHCGRFGRGRCAQIGVWRWLMLAIASFGQRSS